jgi:hypothetical protein
VRRPDIELLRIMDEATWEVMLSPDLLARPSSIHRQEFLRERYGDGFEEALAKALDLRLVTSERGNICMTDRGLEIAKQFDLPELAKKRFLGGSC